MKHHSRKFPFLSLLHKENLRVTEFEDMEMESERWDFGVHLDEDCNKLHHVRKTGKRQFSDGDQA